MKLFPKYLVIQIIALAFCSNYILSQDSLFIKANELYAKNKYAAAVDEYEKILSSGIKSADIYYNLGNAYYKIGQIAQAILNYERALILNPNDKDIIYNLKIANEQTVDRIDEISSFMLKRWFQNFIKILSSNVWAYLSILTFILFLTFVLFFLFGKRFFLKKLFFILSVLLFICAIISFVAAGLQKQKIENTEEAIIFKPSVTVYSTPSENSTELFLLHEGTKVKLIENIGSWYRIQIADGNDGWVEKENFRIVAIY